MTVGERIRAFREENGWTQKQLGEKCKIAEPTIRRYELGKLNPKQSTLKKIATGLGVDVMHLTHSEEEIEEMMKGLRQSIKELKTAVIEKYGESYREIFEDFPDENEEPSEDEKVILALGKPLIENIGWSLLWKGDGLCMLETSSGKSGFVNISTLHETLSEIQDYIKFKATKLIEFCPCEDDPIHDTLPDNEIIDTQSKLNTQPNNENDK